MFGTLFPTDEPISTIRLAGVETRPEDRDGFGASAASAAVGCYVGIQMRLPHHFSLGRICGTPARLEHRLGKHGKQEDNNALFLVLIPSWGWNRGSRACVGVWRRRAPDQDGDEGHSGGGDSGRAGLTRRFARRAAACGNCG